MARALNLPMILMVLKNLFISSVITGYLHPRQPLICTHTIMVRVGDSIPSITLQEQSPLENIDLSKELSSGKGLIIGVPAAFSPSCSDSHIPGYIASDKLKGAGKVFVISINDAYVMRAWGKYLDPENTSGIRFLADMTGAFSEAWDVKFDATAILGNHRSKRYAVRTEDGKVTHVAIEPDNTSLDVSAAEKVL
ncbi:Redoxin-domain-containing protein [Aspergillus unguis]